MCIQKNSKEIGVTRINYNLLYCLRQCSKWAGMCRYTIPELIFVPEFYAGTYQCILYPFIFFIFLRYFLARF
jgi:hypothetical protein